MLSEAKRSICIYFFVVPHRRLFARFVKKKHLYNYKAARITFL